MKEGFEELYTRLYNENIQELESLREKIKKAYTIVISISILAFVCFICMPFLIPIGIFAIIVIGIIMGNKQKRNSNTDNKDYTKIFKEKIITPLINNVFDNGTYEPKNGWTRYEYEKAEYHDFIDRYSSEDMITATIKGKDGIETVIKFAEVHTETRTKDSDGDTHYVTQFFGLAGRMPLKRDIATKIYIRNNGRFFGGKNKVNMDMSEFEKIFDVDAEDKILAVRILTADVMTEMIELYRKFKYRFEIHIINNTLYMRLATGGMFEPNVFKNSLEYKTVERYYLVLQAMMDISTHIYDVINEIEL